MAMSGHPHALAALALVKDPQNGRLGTNLDILE